MLLLMKFMDGFMENHDTLKDISSFHEGCLSRANHFIRYTFQSICGNLGEYFKAYIQQTNRSVLLN